MINELPESRYRIGISMVEYEEYLDAVDRRLYLTAPIESDDLDFGMSNGTHLTDSIIAYNRQDHGIDVEKRKPIRLYINSPGGDITDGFSVVSAIEASTTPVYTINIGQWSSMAFLIGITGHKRFSLPRMTFLMHDGSTWNIGTAKKVQDQAEFEKRFQYEVIRSHVLNHSHMKAVDYDALARVEYYMLPEDALERGFIDYIVGSLDEII